MFAVVPRCVRTIAVSLHVVTQAACAGRVQHHTDVALSLLHVVAPADDYTSRFCPCVLCAAGAHRRCEVRVYFVSVPVGCVLLERIAVVKCVFILSLPLLVV